MKDLAGVIVVFDDISTPANKLLKIIHDIRYLNHDTIPIILCRNKKDDIFAFKPVTMFQGLKLINASAKTGYNVENVFLMLAREILENVLTHSIFSGVILHNDVYRAKDTRSNSCCDDSSCCQIA